MTAQEYIRKVNFMINVGTDFDYKEVYKTLTNDIKHEVDIYFKDKVFTPVN